MTEIILLDAGAIGDLVRLGAGGFAALERQGTVDFDRKVRKSPEGGLSPWTAA